MKMLAAVLNRIIYIALNKTIGQISPISCSCLSCKRSCTYLNT